MECDFYTTFGDPTTGAGWARTSSHRRHRSTFLRSAPFKFFRSSHDPPLGWSCARRRMVYCPGATLSDPAIVCRGLCGSSSTNAQSASPVTRVDSESHEQSELYGETGSAFGLSKRHQKGFGLCVSCARRASACHLWQWIRGWLLSSAAFRIR